MFDFMKRYQAPILWFCVLSLGGLGAWATLSESLRGPGAREGDMGTFQVPGGTPITVDAENFYGTYQSMNRTSRGLQDIANSIQVQFEDDHQVLWCYFVLRALAKEAGVITTDGAIIAAENESAAMRPGSQTIDINLYRKRVADSAREMQRDLTAIRTFRMLSDRARPSATYEQIFDRFKQDYEALRARYAWFSVAPADVKVDPANADDRAALVKFLAEDATLKATNRVPDRVDAEILYVRTADLDDAALEKVWTEKYAALVTEAGLTVTDEQVKARYNGFPEFYTKFAEAAAKARKAASRPASNPAETQPADNPTEFDLVKSRVSKEYLLAKLAEKVHAAWKAGGDPKALAEKYGFRLATAKGLDSLKIQQHPDFPSSNAALQIFQQLRESKLTPPNLLDAVFSDAYACKGAVEEPGSNVAVWRVTSFTAERDPTLDDEGVLTKVLEAWRNKKSSELSQSRADEFRKAFDERVNSMTKAKADDLEKARLATIDARIKEKGLSRDKPADGIAILEIENEEKKKQDDALDAAKAAVEAECFDAVAKEKSVAIRDTGWVRRSNGGRDSRFAAEDKIDDEEKAARFWRKTTRLTSLAELKIGRVGAVQSESAWSVAAVPILDKRREPTVDEMWSSSKATLDQIKSRVAPQTPGNQAFTWENLKNKAWVDLNAPESDKDIDARKETARKEADRKAERERKQKVAEDARTVKLVRDAMSDRPVAPGEGW